MQQITNTTQYKERKNKQQQQQSKQLIENPINMDMIGADKKYIVFGFLLFFFNFKNA